MIKNSWALLALLALLPAFHVIPAYAQEVVIVNQTQPCFLNYTASYNILENCNASDDHLRWVLSGWEWISGGYFTMILVSVLIVSVYAKYKEIIYPIFIGIVYLPFTFFLFPQQFISWAIVMAFIGIGVLIWWVLIRQTER